MSKLFISTLAAIATSGALFSAPIFAQQAVSSSTIVVAATSQTDAANEKHSKANRIELPARAEWMTIKQVYETLEKAGYKDIRSINSGRYGYMARVVNADDKWQHLVVHPTEGTVTVKESRHKNGKDGKHKSHRHHNKDDKA